MMKYKIFFILSLVLTFLSCEDSAKPIPITFVFDQPLSEGNYPSYFKDITEPFSSICDVDYLLKPISVARIDIKKASVETNAWYFSQMGDNTVEFSKNWLSQYFKDSLVVKHLTMPSKRKVSDTAIDNYLKKENVLTLIFSENSDSEIYNGTQIFSSAKDITSEIRNNLCDSKYKEVVVLVNPSKLAIPEDNIGKSTIDVPITSPPKDPCQQPTVLEALELKQDIQDKILNTNDTFNNRINNADVIWNKYFHENAYVALYDDANQSSNDVWDPGGGKNYFTNRLALLESIVSVSIFRVEFATNGKISGLHIIECQNASELL